MANIIKSFVILRNDTEERWSNSSVILKKGEIALSLNESSNTYSIKVGDNVHRWSELPFVTANSKDVSEWAKQTTKPEYTYDEISGLVDYIEEKTQSGSSSQSLLFTGSSESGVVTKDTLSDSSSVKLDAINIGSLDKYITINNSKIIQHDIANSNEYILTLPSTSGILATTDKATVESDGLLSKDDKAKIDSYTSDDIQKWKQGYDTLNTIKTKISEIDFQITDETSLTQISNTLLSIINSFK